MCDVCPCAYCSIKERVEEEIAEIKARADELRAGLGDKVFKMVQGQQCTYTGTGVYTKVVACEVSIASGP